MTAFDFDKSLSIIDPVIAGYEMVSPQVWAYTPEHSVAERLTNTRRAIEKAIIEKARLPEGTTLRSR